MSKRPFVATGDEGDDHAAFEEYVGGVDRAFRLLRLYSDSHASGGLLDRYRKTKEEVFRVKAKGAGYDDQDVDAFLDIQ